MHLGRDRGFTLTELLIVVAGMAIVFAMAVPGIVSTLGLLKLNAAARDVHSEMQRARLRAVSGDRPMRIRFNCPVAGQFRAVELIGTPSAPDPLDSALNRCSLTSYPYPAPDANSLTRPNLDGPLRMLADGITFSTVSPPPTIEFWPDGTAHISGGPPWPAIVGQVVIAITYKGRTRSITVNGVGKVQMQ